MSSAYTNDDTDMSVFAAVRQDDITKLIQALKTHGRQIDIASVWPHPTPMHIAAGRGNVLAIETLIQFGSKAIDCVDIQGKSPMYYATRGCRSEVFEVLVRLGSKAIDTPCNYGWTPLYRAIFAEKNNSSRAVETLLRLGSKAADFFNKDTGHYPIHLAAKTGATEIIELLLRYGSNTIDSVDEQGNTPLHHSVSGSCLKSVLTLLRLGSKAQDTKNAAGKTPLQFAEAMGFGGNGIAHLLNAMQFNPKLPFKFGEEKVLELRYGVYFAESLVSRLLFENDRLTSLKAFSTQLRIEETTSSTSS